MALFNKLLQLGVLAALLVLVVLLWRPAPTLALALAALGGLTLVLMVLVQRKRTSLGAVGELAPMTPEQEERQARFVVTKLLGELTRAQVAYLRQDFRDGDEGRRWLERVLPRSYRAAMDQVHGDLEQARAGGKPKSLRLVLRVLALHERRIAKAEAALIAQGKEHPDLDLAHPVAFVVTENIEIDQPDSEPELHLVAGWDPSKAMLLPAVDALTVFSTDEGKRRAVGQVPFSALREHCELIGKGGKGTEIYQVGPFPSPVDSLPITPVPLGFVIGSSELT
jgi:hypothetical protein